MKWIHLAEISVVQNSKKWKIMFFGCWALQWMACMWVVFNHGKQYIQLIKCRTHSTLLIWSSLSLHHVITISMFCKSISMVGMVWLGTMLHGLTPSHTSSFSAHIWLPPWHICFTNLQLGVTVRPQRTAKSMILVPPLAVRSVRQVWETMASMPQSCLILTMYSIIRLWMQPIWQSFTRLRVSLPTEALHLLIWSVCLCAYPTFYGCTSCSEYGIQASCMCSSRKWVLRTFVSSLHTIHTLRSVDLAQWFKAQQTNRISLTFLIVKPTLWSMCQMVAVKNMHPDTTANISYNSSR